MSAGARRRAVFLDRDGTLVEDVDFLARPQDLRLLPGAAEAIAELSRSGFAVVVVTNQSGIARGLFGERELEEIHALLARELARRGARLDSVYVCPHHPSAGAAPYRRACDCRKPAPGLLVRAARELDLAFEGSWIIGDAERDLEAGATLGLPGILVQTGKGRAELERLQAAGRAPERVAADLPGAVALVLADRDAR